MALTWRTVVLALLGLVPVAVWPHGVTVRWWWLARGACSWRSTCCSPAGRGCSRSRAASRPGAPRRADRRAALLVTNTSGRGVRGAAARRLAAVGRGRRHAGIRSTSPPASGGASRPTLTPTRRGDRLADRVTVRSLGPLGLAARQRSVRGARAAAGAARRSRSRKHLPSRLAVLRQLDGRAARAHPRPGHRVRQPARLRRRRRRALASTGGPPPGASTSWCAPGSPSSTGASSSSLDTSRTSRRPGRRRPAARRRDGRRAAARRAGRPRPRPGRPARRRPGGPRPGRRRRPRRAAARHDQRPRAGRVRAWSRPTGGCWPPRSARLGTRRALVVLLTPLESSAIEEGLLPVLPALSAHHRVVRRLGRRPGRRPDARRAATRIGRGLRRRRRRAHDRAAAAHGRRAGAGSGWTCSTRRRTSCRSGWPTTTSCSSAQGLL